MSTADGAPVAERLIERLRRAVKRRYGETSDVAEFEFPTLGGSNRTVLFDLVAGATRRRMVMRQETVRLDPSPFITPHQQFELLRVAFDEGLPVPEPVFELDDMDELERGYVMTFIGGETFPKKLLTEPEYALARTRFVSQAGNILARLHGIDTARTEVVADTAATRDPLAHQLAIYDSYGEPHPALELALRWLENNRSIVSGRRFVHGDFRNGNFIVDANGINAVLDWECAHLGDPMEDIGWLCLRSWRFGHNDRPVGGFGPRSELYDAYRAAGGEEIDPARVRWWEIFGFVRWAVFNMMQAHGHVTGRRRSLAFAACGRNTCMIEYDLLMTLLDKYS